MLAPLVLAALLSQQVPVPRPFPGGQLPPTAPRTPAPTTTPGPTSAPTTAAPQPTPSAGGATTGAKPPSSAEQAPSDATLGVQVYPGAQFITSYDAGRGQRYYLFGSSASFADLVTWYRTVLKQKGELVFETPATHEFDVGRFREDTMAFPPGVTIKEYRSEMSEGYPNPKPGGQPARFPTVIQIVPVTPDK